MSALYLLATSAFILAALGMLRAALRVFDPGSKSRIPGFAPFVAKPKRIRTSNDPYYRG